MDDRCEEQAMRKHLGFFVLMAATVAAPRLASAQSAVIYGGLGNFDIMNNTGQDAHGFEIQLEGLGVNDVPYSFSVLRYGAAQVLPSASGTGVVIRWISTYDRAAGQFGQTTIAQPANQQYTPGMCYQWTANMYDRSGCEHFGVSTLRNPVNTLYRWLVEDGANPGTLIPVTLNSPVPTPIYSIVPPARPNNPPVLVAEVPAPDPAESPEQFGTARWMKTFKTQLNREVGLDELVSDNPIVPQDPGHLETEWELVQDTPNTPDKQRRRGSMHQGALDANTRAVVRRFEIYEYTGAYDPVTHQAICADLTCTAPSAGELGNLVDAQMAAANVRVPSITVALVGGGSVTSSDKLISCGSKCTAFEAAGAAVTLTAAANSGNVFKGWSGACAGSLATCQLVVNEHADVGATFAQVFTVSLSKSSSGSVVADQPGVDAPLSCGGSSSNCSAKFASGTVLTLTATPAAGKQFLNWSGGACAGSTSPICSFLVAKDTSIQPVFSK
jgi:hypothetical protein